MSVAVNNYTVAGTLTVSGSTALASSLISSSTATFSEVTATTLSSTNCNTSNLSVGGNALFSVPPTCSVLATTASQLTNKAYSDSVKSTLLAAVNIWGGASNTFKLLYAQYFNCPEVAVTTSFFAASANIASLIVSGVSTMQKIHALTFYQNENHSGTKLVSPVYRRVTSGPGAWVVNGGIGAFPIYATVTSFDDLLRSNNVDDLVLVLPGFKLVLYKEFQHSGLSATFDNSTGTLAKSFFTFAENSASSCKLFYNDQTSGIQEVPTYIEGGTVGYI